MSSQLTVSQVALGTSAYWNGDGEASGLVGLAYAGITSAYEGSDPSADEMRAEYDPIVTNMFKEGLSSSSFSLALQRGTDGGYIAFGGLPPVNATSEDFASTDIQTFSLGASNELTFYAMTPDSIVAGSGKASTNQEQYIVDSGTTLVYLPSTLARQLNSLYSPKATLQQGAYMVDCNAKAPDFAVVVGGTTFSANPADMILTDQPDSGSGLCVTGIQDGGEGPFILGDVWMRSVVVVFDVGASQMRFAAHEY
jgi:hypothetical protein